MPSSGQKILSRFVRVSTFLFTDMVLSFSAFFFFGIVFFPRFAAGAGDLVLVTTSRVVASSAALSARSPRNTGCRKIPSPVISVNLMAQTTRGSTQVTGALTVIFLSKGEEGRCKGFRILYTSLRMAEVKPVPVCPMYFSFRS
jgi:hypothetical protein